MMVTFTILSSLLLGMTTATASAGVDTPKLECTDPYVLVGNRCLNFATQALVPYAEARQLCHAWNGELATVLTPTHHKQLVDYIYGNGLNGLNFWLDGTDEAKEGEWVTSSNEVIPLGTPFWYAISDFSQPDNAGGNENCLQLYKPEDYYMNDYPCAGSSYPICEWNLGRKETQNFTSISPLLDFASSKSCPLGFTPVGALCLAFITWQEQSWSEARWTCQEMGGDLAAITDIEMLRDVYLYLHAEGISGHNFWVGGWDEGHEGTWIWTSGKKVTLGTPFWGRWSNDHNQAPDGGIEENCLALRAPTKHYFQDNACSATYNPLCMASG